MFVLNMAFCLILYALNCNPFYALNMQTTLLQTHY